MAGECVSRGSEACGVRGWRSFTDTKKVAGVGVWDQKKRMYEVWGLGQDPSERVQWIGWNTASGLLTISQSLHIGDSKSVCDTEETRFEKKRENDSHFCPHFGAEQKKNQNTRKLQHVKIQEENMSNVVRTLFVKIQNNLDFNLHFLKYISDGLKTLKQGKVF